MPVYEFKDRCTGEVFEEVFVTWRDAPRSIVNEKTGCMGERIISTIQLGYVVDEGRVRERQLEKQGVVRAEPGIGNIAKEARARIRREQESARDSVIRETLAAI